MTKNPPAMWATWVLSLGREDPPEKGMATHSSILAWKIPWQRSLVVYSPLGLYSTVSDSRTLLAVFKIGAASYILIVSNFFPPLQLCNHFRLPVIPCLTSNLTSCQLKPQSQFFMNHLCNFWVFCLCKSPPLCSLVEHSSGVFWICVSCVAFLTNTR